MQEGSRGRVRVKGPSAPAANELWLQMAPLQWRGSVCRGAGLRNATPQLHCHLTLAHMPCTSGLRPLGLPKLLESEKRGQAPTIVHSLHPNPSVLPPLCARLSGYKASPATHRLCECGLVIQPP